MKIGGETRATRINGLIDAAPRVVFEDRNGALWIGMKNRGLNVVRKGAVAAYTTSEGLAGNDVRAIIEDHAGNIWLGTDGGLMRWKDDKFVTFTTHDGLAYNIVDALYEDANHSLWIGTRGGGLTRLKDGKFTSYTAKQGLFSDEIYEIVEGATWLKVIALAVNVALVLYLLIAKRLFGLRGGHRAYQAALHEESLLEVEHSVSA